MVAPNMDPFDVISSWPKHSFDSGPASRTFHLTLKKFRYERFLSWLQHSYKRISVWPLQSVPQRGFKLLIVRAV